MARGIPGQARRDRITKMAEEYRLLALGDQAPQGHAPDPWGECTTCPGPIDWDACPVIAKAKGG